MGEPRPVLAVLGGSFNPPHIGHALLPGYLLARGLADRVLVAPCWDHPLGKALVPFERRMSWLRQTFAGGDPRVEVSAIEAELAAELAAERKAKLGDEQGGRPSYTLELLNAVAARWPQWTVRLCVGSDIVMSGETERWHRWNAIVADFAPIEVPRMGWSPPGEAALPQVSSTEVRALMAELRAGGAGAEAARAGLAQRVPARVAAALERWVAEDEPQLWLVGRGHVASHVAPWLRDRGYAPRLLAARAQLDGSEALPEGRPAGVWLLAQDAGLPALAEALRGRLPAGVPVLHAAGAHPARELLAPLRAAGHPVGTLHPICSLRKERLDARLDRASFGIAGDPAAVALARELVAGRPILDLEPLDARARRAYHAACALVANHLAVLLDAAAAVLRGRGLAPTAVDAALSELMLTSLANLRTLGIPAGITGPLARGNNTAVKQHLEVLGESSAGELYAELSQRLAALLAEHSG